jgi:hypothetical protein
MPPTPDDVEGHTHIATTSTFKEVWAKAANENLERTGDEGRAIGKPTLWWLGRPKKATKLENLAQIVRCGASSPRGGKGKMLGIANRDSIKTSHMSCGAERR